MGVGTSCPFWPGSFPPWLKCRKARGKIKHARHHHDRISFDAKADGQYHLSRSPPFLTPRLTSVAVAKRFFQNVLEAHVHMKRGKIVQLSSIQEVAFGHYPFLHGYTPETRGQIHWTDGALIF